MIKPVLIVVTLALLTGLTGWQVKALMVKPEPLPVLDTLGGDFSLSSTLGGDRRLADFRGEVVLLNFGFTHCPDVCPTALARMREVVETLAAADMPVRPLFVTLDPERDTLERLQPYVAHFGDDFVGMTGTAEEVAAAAKPFKVFYAREEMASGLGYSIVHSSHIYLLDVDGRVRMTFDANVPMPEMIRTVHQLQAAAG